MWYPRPVMIRMEISRTAEMIYKGIHCPERQRSTGFVIVIDASEGVYGDDTGRGRFEPKVSHLDGVAQR